MFPPSLYEYVTKELKKDFILVLNKIDLCPAPLVTAWKHYFQQKYPELHIVMFTTLPGYNLIGKQSDGSGKSIAYMYILAFTRLCILHMELVFHRK